MNIAITAAGPSKEATFDQHFGRAPYFVIIDSTTYEVVKNFDNKVNLNAVQGAGVESAKVMMEEDVSILLTGHVGPKALDVLKMTNVSAYKVEAGTVKEAIEKFKSNNVEIIFEAKKKD
ncbi:MAG: hypothetical protein EOM67_04410 [Spirochaetia bacterium]|nr:hypothetical protein [Spirochaetia bacterium]